MSESVRKQKFKIFRVIARLNTGGPARHVVWLASGLPEKDFESVLVCGSVPPGEGDMSYFAAEHQVRPIVISEMSRELSIKDVISLWKLFWLLKRENPNLIHTHTAKAGTLGRVAGFFYRWLTIQTLIGRPRRLFFVHTYHGHVFHSYYGRAKTAFFLFIERALARFATDRILVLSEQQQQEINKDFKVGRKEQFRIVPLGIDLQQFENWSERRHLLRNELEIDDETVLIGIVGRLTEIKNHELFLRVAKLWQDGRKSDQATESLKTRFVIIGDGHLRGKLEALAEELNLSKQTLVFLGERQDPEVFYPGLDIVALTSLNEGTPLTLIEAMANARAAVSTAVGGTIDLLGASGNQISDWKLTERGILVAPQNETAFFEALQHLIQNKQLREKIGARGLDFVLAKYSKERLIDDIRNLYDELLC